MSNYAELGLGIFYLTQGIQTNKFYDGSFTWHTENGDCRRKNDEKLNYFLNALYYTK